MINLPGAQIMDITDIRSIPKTAVTRKKGPNQKFTFDLSPARISGFLLLHGSHFPLIASPPFTYLRILSALSVLTIATSHKRI